MTFRIVKKFIATDEFLAKAMYLVNRHGTQLGDHGLCSGSCAECFRMGIPGTRISVAGSGYEQPAGCPSSLKDARTYVRLYKLNKLGEILSGE